MRLSSNIMSQSDLEETVAGPKHRNTPPFKQVKLVLVLLLTGLDTIEYPDFHVQPIAWGNDWFGSDKL